MVLHLGDGGGLRADARAELRGAFIRHRVEVHALERHESGHPPLGRHRLLARRRDARGLRGTPRRTPSSVRDRGLGAGRGRPGKGDPSRGGRVDAARRGRFANRGRVVRIGNARPVRATRRAVALERRGQRARHGREERPETRGSEASVPRRAVGSAEGSWLSSVSTRSQSGVCFFFSTISSTSSSVPAPRVFVLLRRARAASKRLRLLLLELRLLRLGHLALGDDLLLLHLPGLLLQALVARARLVVLLEEVRVVAGVVGDFALVKVEHARRDLSQEVPVVRDGDHGPVEVFDRLL
mmetsp:Transcript_13099/g.55040  ORF Transcript_13099/g.55040 Transcript_13099/m.55040 type:complete len:297 (-) Transcript_13099:1792-2682(-)